MAGQYRPVRQSQVLANMLGYGCGVQEAIVMPRGLHYDGVNQLDSACLPRSPDRLI